MPTYSVSQSPSRSPSGFDKPSTDIYLTIPGNTTHSFYLPLRYGRNRTIVVDWGISDDDIINTNTIGNNVTFDGITGPRRVTTYSNQHTRYPNNQSPINLNTNSAQPGMTYVNISNDPMDVVIKVWGNIHALAFKYGVKNAASGRQYQGQYITRVDVGDGDWLNNAFNYTFKDMTDLEEVNFKKGCNTNACTRMYGTFQNCTNLNKVDLTHLESRNIETWQGAFLNCGNIDVNIQELDIYSVTSMANMFLKSANVDANHTAFITKNASLWYKYKSSNYTDEKPFNTGITYNAGTYYKDSYPGGTLIDSTKLIGQGTPYPYGLPIYKSFKTLTNGTGSNSITLDDPNTGNADTIDTAQWTIVHGGFQS
jgi:hypothetical protein|tara:strand:- start:888 stop:1988 length:1101 start_codon:yes stop_codon:yes gene_type:complete